MNILHAPTGNIARGHVLDVAKAPFERALKDLDPQLYVKWNPKKLRGWGCWEIRRRPNRKTALYEGSHAGMAFFKLEYLELNDVHHVLDCAFLNYDAIRKLKEMDTWANKNWVADLERREEEHAEILRQKAAEELKYNIRQQGSAARDFYEMVRSGISPAQILTSIKWGSN